MPITGRFAVDLVAAYRASLDAGAAADDQSGNGRNGTLSGGVTRVSDGGSLAYNFAAATDEINLGSVAAMAFARDAPFTVSFWAKFISLGTTHGVLSYSGNTGTSLGWYVERTSGNLLSFDFQNQSAVHRRSVSAVANGVWHHIVISRDGTNSWAGQQLWLNGVLQSGGVDAGPIAAMNYTGLAARLGRRHSASNGFRGLLDDVLIWDRQVNTEEIADLFAGGRGAAYADTESYPTVVDVKQYGFATAGSYTRAIPVVAGDRLYLWSKGNHGSGGSDNLDPADVFTSGGFTRHIISATGTFEFSIETDSACLVLAILVRGVATEAVVSRLEGYSDWDSGTGQYRYGLGNPGSIADKSLVLSLFASSDYSAATNVPTDWGTAWTRVAGEYYDESTYNTLRVWVDRATTNSRTPGEMYAGDAGYGQTDLMSRSLLVLTATQPPVELTGGVSAAASCAGDLGSSFAVDGAVAAAASCAGDLVESFALDGAIAAAASCESEFEIAYNLDGSVAAVATAEGNVTAIAELDGAIAAVANAHGDVTGNLENFINDLRIFVGSRGGRVVGTAASIKRATLDKVRSWYR